MRRPGSWALCHAMHHNSCPAALPASPPRAAGLATADQQAAGVQVGSCHNSGDDEPGDSASQLEGAGGWQDGAARQRNARCHIRTTLSHSRQQQSESRRAKWRPRPPARGGRGMQPASSSPIHCRPAYLPIMPCSEHSEPRSQSIVRQAAGLKALVSFGKPAQRLEL